MFEDELGRTKALLYISFWISGFGDLFSYVMNWIGTTFRTSALMNHGVLDLEIPKHGKPISYNFLSLLSSVLVYCRLDICISYHIKLIFISS